MPRSPRLDVCGAVHHVIARGIERRNIFRTDRDRMAFVDRLSAVLRDCGTSLYAWCLMGNHFHLLLRSGPVSLSSVMRRLLTGHAVTFNRVHHRSGHLFQNRFKSVLVEEEPYFLLLLAYIHLNPVRAGMISLDQLDHYRWTGHAALLERQAAGIQDVDFVLRHFAPNAIEAGRAYRTFVHSVWMREPGADLDGGGVRTDGRTWERVDSLARGRERWSSDERVLGSSEFVARSLADCDRLPPHGLRDPDRLLSALCRVAADRLGIDPTTMLGNTKRRDVVSARALVCAVGVTHFRVPVGVVARHLRISPQSVLYGCTIADRVLARLGLSLADLLSECSTIDNAP